LACGFAVSPQARSPVQEGAALVATRADVCGHVARDDEGVKPLLQSCKS